MNWSLKEVENLPRISYDYVFPYLNEIKEHSEIYKRKALFFDLVCTGINDSFAMNDDAIVFIRDQLKKTVLGMRWNRESYMSLLFQKQKKKATLSPDIVVI